MLTPLEKEVLAQIDPEQVIAWTQELVRIPSVYRPQQNQAEAEAARWVRQRFEAIGLETHWQEVAPNRPNVIGIWRGTEGQRTLMFEGHTDVVTEGDPAAWTHGGPFSATIVDGKMYGRGANDMKGGLVAALCATQAIIESRIQLQGNILIGALVDEEGQMLGVKDFVAQGWAAQVDAAIICEPEENHLCIAQKGVMWMRITCTGVMCHGAMPLTGVNPTYPIAELLTRIRQLEAAEITSFGNHPFLGQPSITPTIISSPVNGEPQNNVMPEQSQVVLDCRLIPGQSAQQLAAKIEALMSEVAALEVNKVHFEAELIEVRDPTSTPAEAEIVQVLDCAFQDLTGKTAIYGGVPGSTDGTILHNQAGIPIVTVGPGDIHIPHHIDEWLSLTELVEATQLYAIAAIRYLEVSQ